MKNNDDEEGFKVDQCTIFIDLQMTIFTLSSKILYGLFFFYNGSDLNKQKPIDLESMGLS
jgi:hypothetical protein